MLKQMKQTLLVKLAPSKEQSNLLKATMERFNEACNYIAEVAFQNKVSNNWQLHHLTYYRVRERYDLSAQLTVRAITKVAQAYKRDKKIKPRFNIHGAIVYDQRLLSWKGLEHASILTIQGRIKVPIRIGQYQKARIDRIRGEADLILRDKTFSLAATIESPEPTSLNPVGTLGVDLGLKHLAYDSDGERYSGVKVDEVRQKNGKLRANLQKCGSRSAKRHLKKLSGREKRFRRNINHNISKRLVAKAKDTHRRIAIENLKGIRKGVTVSRAQRSRLSSWGFYQLRQFVEYKAALAGVPVVSVNPRGTSHTCPFCGTNKRGNRPRRDLFRCLSCGYAGPSDYIAAINIAARANVNKPIVTCGEAEAHRGIEVEHSYKLLTSVTE